MWAAARQTEIAPQSAAAAAPRLAATSSPVTYHDIANVPLVAQRVIDVGTKRATPANKTDLVDALKDLAKTKTVAWDASWETLLDTELGAPGLRAYPDLPALLDDLAQVATSGTLQQPVTPPKRSPGEARALREMAKFSRVYEPNPSQPNPLATGFHDLDPGKLLKPPKFIKLHKSAKRYFYMRSRSQHNTSNFQIATTGNPLAPGYIYTNNGEFAGNLDQYDKTKKWSRQKRKQDKRTYMGLGNQHKYPQHTVGHVMPFEHSPLVHDTAKTTTGGKTVYSDTDDFAQNLVIENPTVGEQIKRSQVEARMMKDQSYFMQFPIYPAIPVPMETTYNSKPITATTTDSSGNKVVSNTHNRPEKLAFVVDQGSGEEWAEFDNTGVTRYDTKESKRKASGFDTRGADYTQWTGKRVRPGFSNSEIWNSQSQTTATTPFPYLAPIHVPPTDITTYDPEIDAEKSDVPGYMSPPPTPYYGGFGGSAATHQVTGFALLGEAVTTTLGIKGIVANMISFDPVKNVSEVELEDAPEPFTK